MKKALVILVALVVVFLIGMRIFGMYNHSHVLSNQAIFNVYTDLNQGNIDAYFGLEKGTYNESQHMLLCQLPVDVRGFKPKCLPLRTDVQAIDCAHEFDPKTDVKYDNAQLEGNVFKLIVMPKGNTPVNMIDFEMPLYKSKIIAYKDVAFNYKKGEISNIVFSANGVRDYCEKQ